MKKETSARAAARSDTRVKEETSAKKSIYARVLKEHDREKKQEVQRALQGADAGRLLFGKT